MKKIVSTTALIVGVIGITFTAYWFSIEQGVAYPSTPAQIEAQLEFQNKLVAEQEAFQLQLNAAMKTDALRMDSLLQEAEYQPK